MLRNLRGIYFVFNYRRLVAGNFFVVCNAFGTGSALGSINVAQ